MDLGCPLLRGSSDRRLRRCAAIAIFLFGAFFQILTPVWYDHNVFLGPSGSEYECVLFSGFLPVGQVAGVFKVLFDVWINFPFSASSVVVVAKFCARVLCSLAAEDACFRMRITLGVVLIRSLVCAKCVPGGLRSGSGVALK